jgi:curved DNA-binding protein CbpA
MLVGRHKPAAPSADIQAFALLGLGPTATAEDVQAAWRRRVADAHPDKGGSPDAVARLTEARDVLLKRLSA